MPDTTPQLHAHSTLRLWKNAAMEKWRHDPRGSRWLSAVGFEQPHVENVMDPAVAVGGCGGHTVGLVAGPAAPRRWQRGAGEAGRAWAARRRRLRLPPWVEVRPGPGPRATRLAVRCAGRRVSVRRSPR
jgi:hypothetical protein